jgi:hypothetical protein
LPRAYLTAKRFLLDAESGLGLFAIFRFEV